MSERHEILSDIPQRHCTYKTSDVEVVGTPPAGRVGHGKYGVHHVRIEIQTGQRYERFPRQHVFDKIC